MSSENAWKGVGKTLNNFLENKIGFTLTLPYLLVQKSIVNYLFFPDFRDCCFLRIPFYGW